MKRALKIGGLGVAALFVLLTIVAAILPARGAVMRTRAMRPSPSALRPLLADFKNGWSRWSPFEDEGPFTYSGPDRGVGARRDFKGGFMVITRDDPDEVDFHLEIHPITFEIDGSFVLSSSAGATEVTWTDHWRYSLLWFRLFGPMMDHAMQPQFEQGLTKLDAVASGG